ncbi:MAG: triose-phosphate isomerase [Anaerolineae bacterium]|jgi:triosephosphate isomerase
MNRKPLALANWKMAMTIPESLAFVHEFRAAVGDLAKEVDIVLCPPHTALHAVARALADSPIALGAQNLCAAPGLAHTGEISAPLLADAGCEWVMLNHWEIRRSRNETDEDINCKIHAAFEAGLRPILLIGEGATERGQAREILKTRLPTILTGCTRAQVAQMALLYEPEWTIGVQEPAPSEYVTAGCGIIRQWLDRTYGADSVSAIRIIYGGSVTPEYAAGLLSSPQVDGAGAGRQGRDPTAFAEIVRLIAAAKGLAQGRASVLG